MFVAALPMLAGLTREGSAGAPPDPLPLGEINLFVTTDVHSFLASHLHDDHTPPSDADFGDLISFIEHTRARAAREKKDVFFFDNGDVVDGTGLSVTAVDGAEVFPLLTAVPYDALNCGNHELYQDGTVLHGLRGPLGGGGSFIDFWNGTYFTSNIDLASTNASLGARYTILTGAHGTRLLVLGFLYEMPDHCEAVHVGAIHAATRQPWWDEAMQQLASVDAVVVLSHMDYADPLIRTILNAIRAAPHAAARTVAVQFLAGHSHIRAFSRLDPSSSSFEAGHYADTLGFVRFDRGAYNATLTALPLEMNAAALAAAAGLPPAALRTPAGAALSSRILAARQRLGVTRRLGCAARTYSAAAPLGAPASLWGLYLREVAPSSIFLPRANRSQWFISSTGALRYDLYAGVVTVDDVDMALPFADELYVLPRVDGGALAAALAALNGAALSAPRAAAGVRSPRAAAAALPNYVATPSTLHEEEVYDAIVGRFDREAVAEAVARAAGREVTPMRYTNASVAAGSGSPPQTDTEAWMRWAAGLPSPPCSSVVEESMR